MSTKIKIIMGLFLAAILGALYYSFNLSSKSTQEMVAGMAMGKVVIECPENIIEDAVISDELIALTFDGKPYALPRVISGSGEKFSNAQMEIWGKGDEVAITDLSKPDASIFCKVSHYANPS